MAEPDRKPAPAATGSSGEGETIPPQEPDG
jgi:hypothetical protein